MMNINEAYVEFCQDWYERALFVLDAEIAKIKTSCKEGNIEKAMEESLTIGRRRTCLHKKYANAILVKNNLYGFIEYVNDIMDDYL